MPPKRKAAAAAAAVKGPAAKKGKSDTSSASTAGKKGSKKVVAKKSKAAATTTAIDEPAPVEPLSTAKQFADALKKASNDKKRTAKVDQYCTRLSNGQVVDDYDCMLNQTNIGHNNNKFYVIQVIELAGKYYSWNRWGRVGEPGANALKGPFSEQEKAVSDFEKKFLDKTRNHWSNRAKFKAVAGKYTLLEMGEDGEDDVDSIPAAVAASQVTSEFLPCTLDKSTQSLVNLIFDNNMFQEALQNMEIDTKKMPLGKISKAQIAKGFEALEKIEEAIKNCQTSKLADLSSNFYTLIPHNFGRQRPPTISTTETLQKKMDMLAVLADIEIAQCMQKADASASKASNEQTGKVPHILDTQYQQLHCGLKLVDKKSKIYEIISNYLTQTGSNGYYGNLKILDVWEVDRETEDDRFAANGGISNRKLLWHGTNVAVVAAILKSGLRIMPHSGGRVGRGIYFASENSKSAGYVRCAGKIGIMFLNEVALGKEHHIKQDDSSLKSPPKGFDSVIAKGWTEPDPSLDTTIELDGKKVIVPQGKPISQPSFSNSSFGQSEYLIYREDQCRIRYLLKLQFAH